MTGFRNVIAEDTVMNTSISTKLAAIALALMANSLIMGGVAYLFNARLGQPTAVTSVAGTVSVVHPASV
jgi:hypothetical protein